MAEKAKKRNRLGVGKAEKKKIRKDGRKNKSRKVENKNLIKQRWGWWKQKAEQVEKVENPQKAGTVVEKAEKADRLVEAKRAEKEKNHKDQPHAHTLLNLVILWYFSAKQDIKLYMKRKN